MSINKKELTPFFYIDINKIKENYTALLNSFESANHEAIIAYSIKANYHPAIIKMFYSLDSFFEVCSKYEYNMLLSNGIEPQRIIINACSGTNDVFAWGSKSLIIIDNLMQLKYWIENQGTFEVGIRVNLNYFTKDKRFKNKESRFGININEQTFINLLKKADVNKIVCLHCHLSGNNRSPSIYRDVLRELLTIANELSLTNVKYINLGGGFRIDPQYHTYDDYINEINKLHNGMDINYQIIYELGNALVRNSTQYHTKIISCKHNGDVGIAIADGTSLHLPCANFSKTGYHFIRDDFNEDTFNVRQIFGNTCKESDLIIEFDEEKQICIGDTLVIENIGAYSINEIKPLILGKPNIFTSDDYNSCQ